MTLVRSFVLLLSIPCFAGCQLVVDFDRSDIDGGAKSFVGPEPSDGEADASAPSGHDPR